MRPPETVYRGQRLHGPRGTVLGVQVTVDDRPLRPDRSRRVFDHSPTGFEWGYGGSGPAQLALAIVLDVTGDKERALATYQWFKWATVALWGDRWSITAGEVLAWLDQFDRERPRDVDPPACVAVRRCRVCGCTDDDCRQCVAATGSPCHWVAEDLCSRCELREWLKPALGAAEGGAT